MKLEALVATESEKSLLLLDIDKKFRDSKRKLKEEEDLIDSEQQLQQDEIDLEGDFKMYQLKV